MISKEECVILECDNCEKIFENYNGFTIFPEENTAIQEAMDDDWYQDGDKCYCSDCYSLDDNDELIINKLKTKSK